MSSLYVQDFELGCFFCTEFSRKFISLSTFFLHDRLRVKLISSPWKRLDFVIVSVCQMVHHQKYRINFQTKRRLQLFHTISIFFVSLNSLCLLFHHANVLLLSDLTLAYVLCKARIRSTNICGTAKNILIQ